MNQPPLVCVVDDELEVRASICELLRIGNFATQSFGSAEQLLLEGVPAETRCLIVDIRLAGMNGIEFMQRLIADNRAIPCIFVTGHGSDEAIAQIAEFAPVWLIEKPFNPQEFLDAVQRACDTAVESKAAKQVGKPDACRVSSTDSESNT